jgi:hypothetical protein
LSVRAPLLAGRVIAVIAASALVACKAGAPVSDAPGARESPQAKAEPAPLANVPAPMTSIAPLTTNLEAGPPPVPMRGDVPIPADSLTPKEIAGWSLQAVLRPSDVPPPMKAPEASATAIEAVRKKTEARLSIDLAAAHARIVLASQGFALPEDTELRARADRYGFAVILPGAPVYHVAAPGTLRALIGERRIDVAPLANAELVARGDGARRLGLRTRKAEVTNRAATTTFEIAHVADLGEGGAIVCRALLDLMNAPPSTPVCTTDDVPLHAELRWTTHGAIVFDATALARRPELTSQMLLTPPTSLSFALPSIPYAASRLLVTQQEIVAFRTAPAELPPPAIAPIAPPPAPSSPAAGLTLINSTDELRFAWLDGVPIAWLAPTARESIPTLLRGRYTLEWRTFLGDVIDPAQTITVPTTSDLGAPDAGSPR